MSELVLLQCGSWPKTADWNVAWVIVSETYPGRVQLFRAVSSNGGCSGEEGFCGALAPRQSLAALAAKTDSDKIRVRD